MPAVIFEDVWKKFRTGERHNSFRDLIPATVKALTRRRRPVGALEVQEFWALEGVSFEVAQGEALGIIGPNGAGKSTTLKLLTRILKPTRGHSVVTGRVGALIEVAAGFHPDLTGRENVYLQGAVMGMKRDEVKTRFDEIVDFAGVGPFIDTPIKRYSSGMNARLGFAIAAHLRPTVLIIDEVLSVGDMGFQQRCVERMRQFKTEGVTIVFVSHNLQAVSDLCDRALYLNHRPRALGKTADVLEQYVGDNFNATAESVSDEVRMGAVSLTGPDGQPVTGPVAPGMPLCLSVDLDFRQPLKDLTFGLMLHRSTDQLKVYDGHFSQDEVGLSNAPVGPVTLRYALDANVTRGQYIFEVFVAHNPTQRFLARLCPAGYLTINEDRTWGGIAHLGVRASGVAVRERAAQ